MLGARLGLLLKFHAEILGTRGTAELRSNAACAVHRAPTTIFGGRGGCFRISHRWVLVFERRLAVREENSEQPNRWTHAASKHYAFLRNLLPPQAVSTTQASCQSRASGCVCHFLEVGDCHTPFNRHVALHGGLYGKRCHTRDVTSKIPQST